MYNIKRYYDITKNQRPTQKADIRKVLAAYALIFLFLFCFFYPQYPKKLFYPFIYGEKSSVKISPSDEEYFNDIEAEPLQLYRDKYSYVLLPKVEYHGTHRVGYVDSYDTMFNKFYRGQFQGDYIALVPQDIYLVNGILAEPYPFSLFDFHHEERIGSMRCKGVSYSDSFVGGIFTSQSTMEESAKLLKECNLYDKHEYHNNFHPIPASENINKAFHIAVPGDIIYLEGYLSDVQNMHMETATRKGQQHPVFRVGGKLTSDWGFILYTTKVILNDYVYE